MHHPCSKCKIIQKAIYLPGEIVTADKDSGKQYHNYQKFFVDSPY